MTGAPGKTLKKYPTRTIPSPGSGIPRVSGVDIFFYQKTAVVYNETNSDGCHIVANRWALPSHSTLKIHRCEEFWRSTPPKSWTNCQRKVVFSPFTPKQILKTKRRSTKTTINHQQKPRRHPAAAGVTKLGSRATHSGVCPATQLAFKLTSTGPRMLKVPALWHGLEVKSEAQWGGWCFNDVYLLAIGICIYTIYIYLVCILHTVHTNTVLYYVFFGSRQKNITQTSPQSMDCIIDLWIIYLKYDIYIDIYRIDHNYIISFMSENMHEPDANGSNKQWHSKTSVKAILSHNILLG